MNRICSRILTMAVIAIAVATPTVAQDQNQKSRWDLSYELTPLEHKRLRAKGLSNQEVYIAANVAKLRRIDVDGVADAILGGALTGDTKFRVNSLREHTLAPRLEWTTPEWEAAVQRGDWRWTGPTSPQPVPPK